MRVLGLDLGTKTLGIAMSDPLRIIATGLETFRFAEGKEEMALQRVEDLCNFHQIKRIVIGLPLHMSGQAGDAVDHVLAFQSKLKERINIPIDTLDERWTTKLAQQRLIEADLSRKKRKVVIDKMAAVVILQNYLDRIHKEEHHG